jgi:hypothetical protein
MGRQNGAVPLLPLEQIKDLTEAQKERHVELV